MDTTDTHILCEVVYNYDYASTTAVDMIVMTGRPVQTPSDPIIPLVIPVIPPTDRTAVTEGESEL